jgi:hypothetical protein
MSATTISNVRKRQRLLRHRARLSEAWNRLFPEHDFGSGRLREPRSLAADAWNDPGWAEAAREYHKDRADRPAVVDIKRERLVRLRELMADNVSLDRAWTELNGDRPTPQVTIEAILHCVREHGIAALDEPQNIERLCHCDAIALTQINQRIAKLKGNSHT